VHEGNPAEAAPRHSYLQTATALFTNKPRYVETGDALFLAELSYKLKMQHKQLDR
jgi:uncharacterized membrane protein